MSQAAAAGGYGVQFTTNLTGTEYAGGPSVWPAGQAWPVNPSLNGVDLNQQLGLPMDFLLNPPMFQAGQLTSESLNASAWNTISMDTPFADTWGFQANLNDLSQFIVPAGLDGWYLVQGVVPINAPASGGQYMAGLNATGGDPQGNSLWASGEAWQSSGTLLVAAATADLMPLVAGSTVFLQAFPSAAVSTSAGLGNGTTTAALFPQITGRWVSNMQYPGSFMPGSLPPGVSMPIPVPSPTLWTDGQAVTSAQLNKDIQSAIAFYSNPPLFKVVLPSGAAAQSIPVNANTVLTGLAPSPNGAPNYMDPWGSWNAGTSTWTCPVSGMYLMGGVVTLQNPSSTTFEMNVGFQCVQSGISNNYTGAKAFGGATTGGETAAMTIRHLRFSAGDTVQLTVGHDYTSAVSTATYSQAINGVRMFGLWVGA